MATALIAGLLLLPGMAMGASAPVTMTHVNGELLSAMPKPARSLGALYYLLQFKRQSYTGSDYSIGMPRFSIRSSLKISKRLCIRGLLN